MTRQTETSETYRVSERVLLVRGDTFRAAGGPYWKAPDGTKVAMKAYGPYTFHSHSKRGSCEWINATDRDGNYAVLHIAGKRKSPAGLVPRPYTILGKTKKGKRKHGQARRTR